ncbi:unnamed protein product [Ceutorhynchus assimilis]|uniref:Carboxylesterase type B domain-containing protein n=1 Tax=Ceutorhynchus assimilis TaxID=467358 RepID=A0A9N9QCP3_9CUCU|nr:unnamed protein product [Ceutorhynchus assimilis]
MEKFGPDYFFEQDVYTRLTIDSFTGFLCTENYTATENWGLKDYTLALNWVQQNIEKSGGDVKNLILFGQSARAACISILIESPLARGRTCFSSTYILGLFHKAILQSGTSLNPWVYSQWVKKSVYAMAHSSPGNQH